MSDLTFEYRLHESIPETAILNLRGSIDAQTVAEFQDEVEKLERQGIRRFVLDMEGINYVNSTGLGALVRLADKLESDGGFVGLAKIHPKVAVVFEMLGLNAFFTIFASMIQAEEHLASVAKGTGRGGGGAAAGMGAAPAPAAAMPPSRSINCETCGALLRISTPGTFRCSQCYTPFTVPDDGGPVRFQQPHQQAQPAPAEAAPAPADDEAPDAFGGDAFGGGFADDAFAGGEGGGGFGAPAEEEPDWYGQTIQQPEPPKATPPSEPAPPPPAAPAPAGEPMSGLGSAPGGPPAGLYPTTELPAPVAAGPAGAAAPAPEPELAAAAAPAGGEREMAKEEEVAMRDEAPAAKAEKADDARADLEEEEADEEAPAPSRARRSAAPADGKKMKAKAEAPAKKGAKKRAAATAPAQAAAVTRRPVGGTLRRQATVRYFKRMNPFKHFPVVVILSREQIQKAAVQGVAQVTGEKGGFVVKAEKPVVEVVPQFPGCQCVPDRMHVDVSGEQEAVTFWVTPQTEGKLDRAAVEIWYQGERVETIKTPSHVSKRTLARVAAFVGVLFPVFSSSLEYGASQPGMAESVAEGAKWGLATLATQVGGMTMLGVYIGALCIIAAMLSWWLTRPQEASPITALLESEIKPSTDGGSGGAPAGVPIADPGAPLHLKIPCRPHATESLITMIESEARSAGLSDARVASLRPALEEVTAAIAQRGLVDEPDVTYSVLIAPRPGQLNLRFAQHGHAMHEVEMDPLPVARATFDEFKIGPHSKGGDLITLRVNA